MKKKNRHELIIDLLSNHLFMKIEDLCNELNVSPATIRRDLSILEETGQILRINGGAILPHQNADHQADDTPADPYADEKRRIAEAAVSLIKEGDTIFMDASSTNFSIAEQLSSLSNITIVTNSIVIAHKFINRRDLSVIICGGTLGEVVPDSVVGPLAEKMISMFRANICFLGTSGIHLKQGITDRYLSAARIKEIMIENSTKVCVVSDRSKFGVINTAFVCPIERINMLITDNLAPEEDVRLIRSRGISVTLV